MQTKGWDTLSIVKQDAVNASLSKSWPQLNPEFNQAVGDSYRCSGVFDCWSVVNGGGGRLLRLRMPIRSGELKVGQTIIELAATVAIIEVTLSLLPQSSTESVLKSSYLKVAQNPGQIPEDQGGWLLPITLQDPQGRLGPYASLVLDAICAYLIANPKQFEHIFAHINFAKPGAPAWALPKKCTYSYLDSGYLAVLGVCSDRDISELPRDVDVTGLGLGASSYYILANQMLLENLILPGLVALYQDASKGDYQYQAGELINRRQLRMQEIKSGLIYYTPVVWAGKNIARVVGDFLRVKFDGNCDLYAGINMTWNGWVTMKPTLNNGVITFSKLSSDFQHDEDIPWYLQWLLPVVGLIVTIVVAVISNDLISSIANRGGSIKADSINCTTWNQATNNVIACSLSEALVVEYV
ncbi:TULIP family P47-like protein [Pseudomonas rubra]|uniref:TULIP family P47-like protein n=1 Tax=Pseudomonas rubra TaxID=2942627 RepID=A0ABT5P2S9_9PSED|nr:TULIP family P47-like protein [Pseudomonas rubra]MDD1012582.1 TULIP family P47-like protein [Pseudomonas rubra]MDD1041407.1 TULIP family P47-like protein [Pseudomonas rubra]MDD1153820.1 TULIP family P47-like protein [Pseudomonas rubra]